MNKDVRRLFKHPFWWAGFAMGVGSIFIGVWSPLCFIGGIFTGVAIAECAMQASKTNATLSHEEGGKEQL